MKASDEKGWTGMMGARPRRPPNSTQSPTFFPGAGITLENVSKVVSATHCTQVHLARHKALPDPSVNNNRSIYYGGALYPPEDRFDVTDRDYVAAVRGKLG